MHCEAISLIFAKSPLSAKELIVRSWTTEKSDESFAKSFQLDNKPSDKSFIQIKNKRGLNTDPCGTPEVIPFHKKFWSFNNTLCFRCFKKSLKTFSRFQDIPLRLNFRINLLRWYLGWYHQLLFIVPYSTFTKWRIIDGWIKLREHQVMMTVWVKKALKTRPMTRFGWEVNIKFIKDEDESKKWVGWIIHWCSPWLHVKISVLVYSYHVLSLSHQVWISALKSPRAIIKKGYFLLNS